MLGEHGDLQHDAVARTGSGVGWVCNDRKWHEPRMRDHHLGHHGVLGFHKQFGTTWGWHDDKSFITHGSDVANGHHPVTRYRRGPTHLRADSGWGCLVLGR